MRQLLFSVVLIVGMLFSAPFRTEALSNPLGFNQEESSYLPDNNEVIEPDVSLEPMEVQKEELNMDDLFGSEQVFPFEPGFS